MINELRDERVTVWSIHPVDDLDRELASVVSLTSTFPMVVTRDGVLSPTPSGDRIDLLTWPQLAPTWSVDLSSIVDRRGSWEEILTSDVGMVVISAGHRSLHAYG